MQQLPRLLRVHNQVHKCKHVIHRNKVNQQITASQCSFFNGYTGSLSKKRYFSNMEDEYGAMDDGGLTYNYDGVYNLDLGGSLKNPRLRYQTYGKLNEAKDNVLVVCHALTGNAR